MTDRRGERRPYDTRRTDAIRELLDAAWSLMDRDGVAALSVRELARQVGLRQQSVTYYFPTKADLFDALFIDGFGALRERLEEVRPSAKPVDHLVATIRELVTFCADHPAHYHLMLQRTVPGFTPTPAAHQVALDTLQVVLDRLAAAGVTRASDIDAVRGLANGLAAEQIANDPGGDRFVRQTSRAVRALLAGLAVTPPERTTNARRRTPPRTAHRARSAP